MPGDLIPETASSVRHMTLLPLQVEGVCSWGVLQKKDSTAKFSECAFCRLLVEIFCVQSILKALRRTALNLVCIPRSEGF